MKKIGRVFAVFAYLFIASLVLQLKWKELINIKELLLIIVGGMLLYLPNMEWKNWRLIKGIDYDLIGRNILFASYIESFVLLFFMIYDNDGVMGKQVGLCLRPLFYGVCIWIALCEGKPKRKGKVGEEKSFHPLTAEECYECGLKLGLTKREAEIAVQIGKGLSNKQIAQELYITETTVKKHVSNIFAKLDIKRREDIRKKLEQNEDAL